MATDKSTKNKSTKKKGLRVDFKDVETRSKIPDGEFHVKVTDITVEDGDKAQYLSWEFEVMDPEYKGRKVYTNTSLAPQALWNLRSLLESLGVETPDSEFELDLESYKEMEMKVTITNEKYEGKDRPKVTDYSPLDGTAESDDDEASTDDDSETESEDEEEESSDDEDGSSDEEEASDDEEEAPPPKKDKKAKAVKYTEDEVKEMDADEMKSLLKKHGLKVKGFDEMRASKQVAAVIDALEGASLLAD